MGGPGGPVSGTYGILAARPAPLRGAGAGLEVLNMRLVLRPGDRPGQLRGAPGPGAGQPAKCVETVATEGTAATSVRCSSGKRIGKENRERESGKRIGKEGKHAAVHS